MASQDKFGNSDSLFQLDCSQKFLFLPPLSAAETICAHRGLPPPSESSALPPPVLTESHTPREAQPKQFGKWLRVSECVKPRSEGPGGLPGPAPARRARSRIPPAAREPCRCLAGGLWKRQCPPRLSAPRHCLETSRNASHRAGCCWRCRARSALVPRRCALWCLTALRCASGGDLTQQQLGRALGRRGSPSCYTGRKRPPADTETTCDLFFFACDASLVN